MGARSDAAVIAASLDDPAEFGRIFDRYATVMYRYFVRRVDTDMAQELLGELFRIAFERRGSFDQTRTEARPWLYGIASRLVAKHWRSEYRRLNATARLAARSVGGPDATEPVDARLDVDAVWPHVAKAVADLPSGERDVLVLRAWEDLSYDEIAQSLDIPVGTVRSRLNRVRRRLRDLDTTTGRQQHD
ncbi:MAG: RNA polymerase sigma factor [Actinomycetota bacterium]